MDELMLNIVEFTYRVNLVPSPLREGSAGHTFAGGQRGRLQNRID